MGYNNKDNFVLPPNLVLLNMKSQKNISKS